MRQKCPNSTQIRRQTVCMLIQSQLVHHVLWSHHILVEIQLLHEYHFETSEADGCRGRHKDESRQRLIYLVKFREHGSIAFSFWVLRRILLYLFKRLHYLSSELLCVPQQVIFDARLLLLWTWMHHFYKCRIRPQQSTCRILLPIASLTILQCWTKLSQYSIH